MIQLTKTNYTMTDMVATSLTPSTSPQEGKTIFLGEGVKGNWFSSSPMSHESRNVDQAVCAWTWSVIICNLAHLPRFITLDLLGMQTGIKRERERERERERDMAQDDSSPLGKMIYEFKLKKREREREYFVSFISDHKRGGGPTHGPA